jgi:hypothetical protein
VTLPFDNRWLLFQQLYHHLPLLTVEDMPVMD